MKNWLRNIKNIFRNIFWRNENEKIIIEDKFPIEDSFSKESMNTLYPNTVLNSSENSFEKELTELRRSDSEKIDINNNFSLGIETEVENSLEKSLWNSSSHDCSETIKEDNPDVSSMDDEIKEEVENHSNDLCLKTEEFPTLTHHKIELEKKPQLKKKHVIKKKKTTHLTAKQHHSKGLTIKLPKNIKNKSN